MSKQRLFHLFFSYVLAFVSVEIIAFVIPNQAYAQSLKTVTFQSIPDDIANPERGFMRQSNISVDQPYAVGKLGSVQATDTVDWVYFHMEKYRDPRDGKGVTVSSYQFIPLEPIGSGKGLDTVSKTFADARTKGLKLVIRFLYLGYSGIGSTQDIVNAEPDVPLSVALQHINQLAPVINQNKDVVMTVQAGFVGYWGEWHSSKYLSDLTSRKAIVDEWLKVLSPDRMIDVRYPKYVQNFYGGPISEAEAYTQSSLSRVGFHDDAFVKDDTDDGTFTSTAMGMTISNFCGTTQCWRDYFGQTSKYTPAGGEAGTHSTTASTQADCPNSLAYLAQTHFSYLHNAYSMVTLNNWTAGGCMPEIRRRLGYRFSLSKATVPNSVAQGGTMPVHLEIVNEGFGNMFNPRPVNLVFEQTNGSAKATALVPSIDPRRWMTQADKPINIIDANVTIPASLPNGTYRISLWLPDASSSIASDPRYAVRFANANVWQATSGYNVLTDGITVSSTGGGTTPSNTPGTLEGDINNDGKIDIFDFDDFVTHFGQAYTPADFNRNGILDIFDFNTLITNFGKI